MQIYASSNSELWHQGLAKFVPALLGQEYWFYGFNFCLRGGEQNGQVQKSNPFQVRHSLTLAHIKMTGVDLSHLLLKMEGRTSN